MTQEFNPYQPPTTNTIKINPNGEYWAEGKLLVMPIGQTELPHRCIYCNKPITVLKKKTFYKSTLQFPFFKKVLLQFGLCNSHRIQRIIKFFLGWILFFGSFILSGTDNYFSKFGALLFFIAIISLSNMSYILIIKKIKNGLVYIKKCGKPFLNSLPKNSL